MAERVHDKPSTDAKTALAKTKTCQEAVAVGTKQKVARTASPHQFPQEANGQRAADRNPLLPASLCVEDKHRAQSRYLQSWVTRKRDVGYPEPLKIRVAQVAVETKEERRCNMTSATTGKLHCAPEEQTARYRKVRLRGHQPSPTSN